MHGCKTLRARCHGNARLNDTLTISDHTQRQIQASTKFKDRCNSCVPFTFGSKRTRNVGPPKYLSSTCQSKYMSDILSKQKYLPKYLLCQKHLRAVPVKEAAVSKVHTRGTCQSCCRVKSTYTRHRAVGPTARSWKLERSAWQSRPIERAAPLRRAVAVDNRRKASVIWLIGRSLRLDGAKVCT